MPDDFDWYLLIGDSTALPAIGRRLEELRAGVPVKTVVLVADAADAQAIETGAEWTPHWIVRVEGQDEAVALRQALAGQPLPAGDGFVWIAAEAGVARAVRGLIVDELGHPREWTKAAGYWRRGVAAAHTRIED
ncbi:siderophore-interacting protein [Sphingomonas bacterium]|uniref:siderophore-interacting protein n=1 Tax=Sphingomonas bacterium TaxID=1895847 RepID=UPI0020C67C35|nr:siderophore-interacting protein [Sphingomonas bacterium]